MSNSTTTQRKPRKSSRSRKVINLAKVFLATAAFLILSLEAVSQATSTTNDCSPLVFPAGSKDEVISIGTEFLTKVETVQEHPYWPGTISGVTLGIGWDAGYHSQAELRRVWAELGTATLDRLSIAAGKKGADAKGLLSQVKSVRIPAEVSRRVLVNSLRDYYYQFVTSHFPGLNRLPAEAQVVLISLVFNRGIAMGHDPDWRFAKEVDKRWEFRELRRDVHDGDLFAIYTHLGTMKRLWEQPGSRGLRIRRRDEQALIRPYVDKQLRWEEKCGST